MKIYSDAITADVIRSTTREVPGLYIDELSAIPGARVRKYGYVVRTGGNTNRLRNSGVYGADHSTNAASWDQHGQWFALLYAIDPNARIAIYDGANDFHERTKGKYRKSEPSTLATHGAYLANANQGD